MGTDWRCWITRGYTEALGGLACLLACSLAYIHRVYISLSFFCMLYIYD